MPKLRHDNTVSGSDEVTRNDTKIGKVNIMTYQKEAFIPLFLDRRVNKKIPVAIYIMT